ncbi:VirB2 family type IV secretion system major pilin TrwL [Bartonella tribocorum]|uniref:Conjugal transfer protein n=1 Tax=Bartonella tribocorum TaxID=85701 RepID=A0A2M6USH9_9HYPH|nr:VirB2 family type IV secretion system major pilin TrwL [Bartonella tribocorum]PIT69117.1 conjugal transfer protein [Bartonella tribocorum]
MRKLMHFQSKNNSRIIAISAALIAFFMAHPTYADLGNANRVLTALQTELSTKIIPVAAALILLCLAIGYTGRYIEKDTFVRWAIGVIIAGSAT